jgi:hypothetical protein
MKTFSTLNGNRLVNSTDTSIIQSQSSRVLTVSNFRADINANAVLNSTDPSSNPNGLP